MWITSTLKRFIRSLGFAYQGIRYLFRTQTNAQIHLVAASGVLLLGCWLRLSQLEWCVIILCFAIVFAAEAMNTAIEVLLNYLHPSQHPQVGLAKDLAAAAVLLSALGTALVGAIIFIPKILAWVVTWLPR
jgi:diacylglycerol kinase